MKWIIPIILILTTISVILSVNNFNNFNNCSENNRDTVYKYIDTCFFDFNEESLRSLLKALQIKHDSIVFAQAILETSRFMSKVFVNSNNLFGMKIPNKRFSLRNGSFGHYSKYDHWIESVIDYKIWQNVFYTDTTQNYYLFLKDLRYARDPYYVNKLKIIEHDEQRKNSIRTKSS